MNILDTPGRLAQIGNDVFNLLWSKSSERENPPEPAHASATQPELRNRERTSEALQSGRSRAAPMPSVAAVRSRVQAVIEGTGKYDAIDVDKDDCDEQNSLQQPAPQTIRTQQNRSLFSDRKGQKDEIVIDSDDESTPKDTHLLKEQKAGRSKESPERTGLVRSTRRPISTLHQPRDAVLVKPPGPRPTQDMSFIPHRNRFRGGPYGPVNTMDKPKDHPSAKSTKDDHFMRMTRNKFSNEPEARSTQRAPAKKIAGSPRSSPASLGNDEPPHKRLRIDSEQNSSLGRQISQQQPATQSMGMRRDTQKKTVEYRTHLSKMYGLGDEGEDSIVTNNNPVYPASPIFSSHTPSKKHPMTKTIPRHRASDAQFDALEDGDEKFMHDATRQRKSAPSDSEDELTAMKSSTEIGNSGCDQARSNSLAVTKAKSHLSSPTTPTTAATLNNYDNESPDELFGDQMSHRKPRRPRPKLSPINGSRQKVAKFPLKIFLYHTYSIDNCEIELEKDNKVFSVSYREETLSRDALTPGFPVDKITALCMPSDRDKNIVILRFSGSVVPGNCCFLQFESSEAVLEWAELVSSLTPGIRRISKDSGHNESALGKAYAKATAVAAEAGDTHIAHHPVVRSSHKSETTASVSKSASRPTKLRDQLDSPHRREDISHEAATTMTPIQQASRQVKTASGQQPVHNEGVGRITRSIQRQTLIQSQPVSPPPPSLPRRQGNPWKRPLTYPRDGIKRESVTWDDLARLEDHEFLNDSLVGLFLRYLQEECKESTKRMHFFSTFFYETLTRSKKGINYQGVCNWTKKIDIFNRDFIIVPVNESAHWFVMIICNPRALMDKSTWLSDKDVDGLEATDVDMTSEVDAPRSKVLIESDLVDLTATKSTETDIDELVDRDSPRKRAGRRKSKRRSLPKYELNRPVIITLDSLAMGRSPNASVLKDYLIREAYEKRGQVIEKSDIAGMTGKEIPTQGNFSDCGLYLCMYLEQFMKDPDRFMMSILQRDTEVLRWPKHIPHGALRQRLYDMLQSLYSHQHGKPSIEVPPVGHILIREEDYLTPTQKRIKNGLDNAERYCSVDQQQEEPAEKAPAEYLVGSEKKNTTFVRSVQDQSASDKPEGDANVQPTKPEAIVIEDESHSPRKVDDELLSRYFSKSPDAEQRTARVPEADPQQLANRLRSNRSPAKGTNLSVDSPASQKLGKQGHRRSVSTNFLDGLDSYEDDQQRTERRETSFVPLQHPDEEFHGFGDHPARYGSTVPESANGDDDRVQGSDMMLIED